MNLLLQNIGAMTDGELSALLTVLAVPAGGLISLAILWVVIFWKGKK